MLTTILVGRIFVVRAGYLVTRAAIIKICQYYQIAHASYRLRQQVQLDFSTPAGRALLVVYYGD